MKDKSIIKTVIFKKVDVEKIEKNAGEMGLCFSAYVRLMILEKISKKE